MKITISYVCTLLFVLFCGFNIFAQDNDLVNQDYVEYEDYTFPGDENTKLISFDMIKSKKVRDAFDSIDIPYEMADGYYSTMSSAYYMLFHVDSGKLVGFMKVELLSYTEDPELYLVSVIVNTKGQRLGRINQLSTIASDDVESIKALPKELHPQPENNN